MLNELIKYFAFLSTDKKGKRTIKKIILFLIITIVLFGINKFFFVKFIDGEYFQINSALSNMLFIKGISPYSKDLSSILENYFSTRGTTLISYEFLFQQPIYQLIFYLPFSLMPDLNLSLSIWLTLNQCVLLLSAVIFIKLLKWEPGKVLSTALIGIILVSFYGISNYLAANTSIFQLFFLILSLKFFYSKQFIGAGLLLGLATIDPFNFSFTIFFFLAFLISRKQIKPFFWFSISIILLTLTGLIFDSGWILKFFRNIFLEGTFFPFIDYNHALLNWISKLSSGSLINFVPILLIIWIFIEYSRLPKHTSNHLFWILSLIVCINPFIIMRETNYASILYLLPIIFIVFLWETHSNGIVNYVIYGILFFNAVALPYLIMRFPATFNFVANFHSIDLINSILIIIVLYWIRWWVVKPYDTLLPE